METMFYFGVRLIFLFLLFLCIIRAQRPYYENIVATAGDCISLECAFSDPNTLAVEWKLNDQRIMIHDIKSKVTTKMKGYTSSLRNDSSAYLEFQVNDTQEEYCSYECVTYSGTGSNKETTWIIQLQIERYTVTNITLMTSVGKTIRFNCTWDISKSPSAIEWRKDGSIILDHDVESAQLETEKYVVYVVNNTAWLEISVVDLDDSGVYSCFFVLTVDKKKIPRGNWIFQVQGRPHIFFTMNNTTENETLETTCCVEFGLPPPTNEIRWLLSGKMLELSANINKFREENETICSNLTFVIRRTHNQQSLDCLVLNELNESSSVMLNVLYSPIVKMDLTISSRSFFSFSLILTKNGSLLCTAEGNPQPLVTLEKQLPDGHWREILVDSYNVSNTALTAVKHFSLQNMSNGLYRCAAKNGVGPTQVSQETNIDVELNIPLLVIVFIAAITALLFLFELVSCLKASIKRHRAQNDISTNMPRSQEMNDDDSLADHENDFYSTNSLQLVKSPSYNDVPSMKTFDNVYLESTTRATGPTDSNEEDYMNCNCEDLYTNMQNN